MTKVTDTVNDYPTCDLLTPDPIFSDTKEGYTKNASKIATS